MRSGQIGGEIFIYILAILIIGTIVIFGYKKAVELKEKGEDISVLQFKKQLESLIQSSMGSGNVFVEELPLPGGFSKICFIDRGKTNPSPEPSSDDLPSLVYNSWKDDVDKNIFLLQGSKVESFYIDKDRLKVDASTKKNCKGDSDLYLCCNALNGKVKLKFSGKGRVTFIAES